MTDLEVPVTVPIPWLIERDVAPETDQDRVEDWPEVIDEGEALKEEIVGGLAGGACVVALADEDWDETFPAASLALTVYV